MSFNTVLIIIILVICAAAAIYYMELANTVDDTPEYDSFLTVEHLSRIVNETFATTLKKSLLESSMSEAEYRKRAKNKEELKSSMRTAAYGDKQAKKYIIDLIKDILQNERIGKINQNNIDSVIPFNNYEQIKSRDMFEILTFLWLQDHGPIGFTKRFSEYELDKPKKTEYGNKYEVTGEEIKDVFLKEMEYRGGLTYQEKVGYLAQRVFENNIGCGAVDLLLETTVDEVQGGTSGIPFGSYEVKTADLENAAYSYESIWIVYCGLNIHLSCTTFGTQSELERICRNIYRYNAPYILTRRDAKVVATMKDGTRITVSCPPFAESYNFFARKFDSTPSIEPDELLTDDCSIIPITIMKWIVYSFQNFLVTGDQGSGKTTLLKSIIRYFKFSAALRVNEIQPEMNLRYTYTDRNIVAFSETEHISTQEGLDFQKKTSGLVNIIGEIATAVAACWYIQTTKVASRSGAGTHHAKTVKELITAMRDNIIDVMHFTNDKAAEQMVADAIDFDIHMTREEGHRFNERITEINAVREEDYPYEDIYLVDEDISTEKAIAINREEYQKRMTDRRTFSENNICIFNKEENRYQLVGFFTDSTLERIRKNLDDEEREAFEKDMEMIRQVEEKAKKTHRSLPA